MPIPAPPLVAPPEQENVCGVTLQALIDDTKRHLLSGHREELNLLAAPLVVGSTSVTFTYNLTNLPRNSTLAIGTEILYVWETDVSTRTATVSRGHQGSVEQDHALGATVYVNPRFSDYQIARAINDDLRDLSSPMNGLYAVRTVDLTQMTGVYDYELPNEVQAILAVRYRSSSVATGQWYEAHPNSWRVDRGATFTSGLGIRLRDRFADGTVRVVYRTGFGSLTLPTDDVGEVAGLPCSAVDLPPMGAAMRLMLPRDLKRTFTETQGDTRRAEEVPVGAATSSLRGLASARQQRIAGEAARLAQQHPYLAV